MEVLGEMTVSIVPDRFAQKASHHPRFFRRKRSADMIDTQAEGWDLGCVVVDKSGVWGSHVA